MSPHTISAAFGCAGSSRAAIAGTLAALLAVPAFTGPTVSAATEGVPTVPMHGGVLNTTKEHTFESVLGPDGIRVYVYTDEKAPSMVEKAKGTAMLKLEDGRSLELKLAPETPGEKEAGIYFCPMHPEVVQETPGECDLCGGMILYKQDRLFGKADLSGVNPERVNAMIRLTGLSGREKEATFAPAFRKPDRKAEKQNSGTQNPTKATVKSGPEDHSGHDH